MSSFSNAASPSLKKKKNKTTAKIDAQTRWQIATDGAAFSIQETLITPGLDTVTNITRTITTSTTSETTSTFGQ